MTFIFIGSFQIGVAQLMVGAGSSYGTDIMQYAPNFRLYYFPNDKICLGPEFALFPKVLEEDVERKLVEFGFSGHYIFQFNEHLGLYPLVGLNYAIETETEGDIQQKTSSFGVNIGGGFHLEYGRFFPFAEYKYVASGLPQSVLSIGLLVNINRTNKESETGH